MHKTRVGAYVRLCVSCGHLCVRLSVGVRVCVRVRVRACLVFEISSRNRGEEPPSEVGVLENLNPFTVLGERHGSSVEVRSDPYDVAVFPRHVV